MSQPEPTSIECVPFIAYNLCVLFVLDGPDYQSLLGSLDYAYLFAYAIGMFVRFEKCIACTFSVNHLLALWAITVHYFICLITN